MKLLIGHDGYEKVIGPISLSHKQVFGGFPGDYVIAQATSGIRSNPITLHNNVGETNTVYLNVKSYTDDYMLSIEQYESSEDTFYHDGNEEEETCLQDVEDFSGGYAEDDNDSYSENPESFLEHLLHRTTRLVCSDANLGGELTKEILDYHGQDRCVQCGAGIADESFESLEGSPTDHYTIYPSHLPANEYEKLKHDIITSLDFVKEGGGGLNPDVFTYTKGFVVEFSRAGMLEIGKDPRSGILSSMLRSALPESNWFIMNVLNAPPSNKIKEEVEEPEDTAVAWHMDSFKFCKNDLCASFNAKAVQVLYISIPSNMEGGNLAFHMDSERSVVTPENNMLVKFDGRLLHSVSPFSSPSNEHRISLVLESYVLPPSWLETAPDLIFL